MSTDFDPYYKWLGIPPAEQPPNHYRMLGIPVFTDDPEVIENAADQRMAHLRTVSTGQRSQLAQQLLNHMSSAKVCLLSPDQKRKYDVSLQQRLNPIPEKPLLQPTPLPVQANPPVAVQITPILPIPAKIISPTESIEQLKSPSPVVVSATKSLHSKRRKSSSPQLTFIAYALGGVAGIAVSYVLLCMFSPKNDVLGLFRKAHPTNIASKTPTEPKGLDQKSNQSKQIPTPPLKITPPIQDSPESDNSSSKVPKQDARNMIDFGANKKWIGIHTHIEQNPSLYKGIRTILFEISDSNPQSFKGRWAWSRFGEKEYGHTVVAGSLNEQMLTAASKEKWKWRGTYVNGTLLFNVDRSGTPYETLLVPEVTANKKDFLGQWKITPEGEIPFIFTLNEDGTSNSERKQGRWISSENCICIGWEDGWKHILERLNNSWSFRGYAPGKSQQVMPDTSGTAVFESQLATGPPIENSIQQQIELVIEREPKNGSPTEYRVFTNELLALLKQATENGKDDIAKKYMDRLLISARKSSDLDLERQVTLLVIQLKWPQSELSVHDERDDKIAEIHLLKSDKLDSWTTAEPIKSPNWNLNNHILTCVSKGPPLITKEKYFDFELHAEFLLPAKCNTGIFLRGRYELQLMDPASRWPDGSKIQLERQLGSIWDHIAPTSIPYFGNDEWNSVDVKFVGRRVTIWVNKTMVINSTVITSPTEGALDKNENDPGPIMLQTSTIPGAKFRNIIIKPLK